MKNPKLFGAAALLLSIGVAMGAFGGHLLADHLTEARMATFKTSHDYHMWMSLGLMLVGLVGASKTTVYLLTTGLGIFCGSLYLLVLTDIGLFGAITPVGGASLIVGWAAFAFSILKAKRQPEPSDPRPDVY